MNHFIILTNKFWVKAAIKAIHSVFNRHRLFSVEIKLYRPQRSLAQNRLFHMWVGEIAEHFGVDTRSKEHIQAIKDAIKLAVRNPIDVVDPFTGEIRQIPISTSSYGVSDMADFLNDLEMYALQQHGIKLSQPQEYELARQGIKDQLKKEVENNDNG